MHVLSVRSVPLSQGGEPWNVTFTAQSNVEYQVEMRPSESLLVSAMQMIAPHSHHVMASRSDESAESSGRKVMRWAATEAEVGVDVSVEALSGSGSFDLDITIEATLEALAPEAITMPQHCATSPDAADCAAARQWTILMNCVRTLPSPHSLLFGLSIMLHLTTTWTHLSERRRFVRIQLRWG